MSIVDVSGIDRMDLLEALWKNAKPASFFTMNNVPSPYSSFSRELAKTEIWNDYADYIQGRCIKVKIMSKQNQLDGRMYDSEHGQGSFEKIVSSLKNKSQK